VNQVIVASGKLRRSALTAAATIVTSPSAEKRTTAIWELGWMGSVTEVAELEECAIVTKPGGRLLDISRPCLL
jgi:hypothetical protein